MDMTANAYAAAPAAPIRLEASLFDRAKANDQGAVVTMFQQFMSPDEDVYFAEYCGVLGIWGIGTHCFACLTNRRIAALQVGLFGKVLYQDGYLEHTNSGVIYQPSLLWLYLWGIGGLLFGLFGTIGLFSAAADLWNAIGGAWGLLAAILTLVLGVGFLTLAFFLGVKLYHAFNKCGLLWWIREGVSVHIFTNRSKLSRANHLYRLCTQLRDERLKLVGHP